MKVRVTADQPCEIPVLGRFAAGETKEIDDTTQQLFELQYGYKVTAGNFPKWVTLTAILEPEEIEPKSEAPAEDTTTEGEEV